MSQTLCTKLNTEVVVRKVEMQWLNRMVLKDVTIMDQHHEPLMEANTLYAGFKLLPLLQKRWVFTTVRLFGFSLNIRQETPESPLNLQFILDALASDEPSPKQPDITLQINAIMMRQGNVSYHIDSEPTPEQGFSSNHIDLHNINGKLSVGVFRRDTFEAKIHKLSCEERSGLQLKRLSMVVRGNQRRAFIEQLSIQLPGSHLKIPEASLADITQPTSSPITFQLASSTLLLRDLAPLSPLFKHYNQPLQLSASASGSIDDLFLENITLMQEGMLSFNGKLHIKELTRSKTPYLFGKVNALHLNIEKAAQLIDHIKEQQNSVPPALLRLGRLDFSGEISGFTDKLVAYGKAHFDIGSLDMDLLISHDKEIKGDMQLKGKVASSELKINELFDEDTPFGTIEFKADVDASKQHNSSFKGLVQAQLSQLEYKNYSYKNILLSGRFQADEFEGSIEMDDPNGKLLARGLVKNKGKESAFLFNASLTDIRPDKLHLTEKYDSPKLSCEVTSNFTGNDLHYFDGEFTLEKLDITTAQDTFHLERLNLSASGEQENKRLVLTSDILNADVSGAFTFASLYSSLKKITWQYLPSLSTLIKEKEKSEDNSLFALSLTIDNTEALSNCLKLPFTNFKQGTVRIHYDHTTHEALLDLQMPQFKIGKSAIDSCVIRCYNQEETMMLDLHAALPNQAGHHNALSLTAAAAGDQITSTLKLRNRNPKGLNLDIDASTLFVIEEEEHGTPSLRTEISIEPNTMKINDLPWQLSHSSITIAKGNTHIDNFTISNGEQHLNINGTASKEDPQETIQIDLNDLELSYIFDLVNIPALQFGGSATGIVRVNDLYGSRILNTDLEIQQFSFNDAVQGKLNLFSEWDNDQQGILLLGTIYHDETNWTDVNGYIYPAGPKEGLSLYFDAKGINMALLKPYVESFSQTIEGRGTGKVHLFGPFEELTFEGEAYVKDAVIGVAFLNTVYHFSDSIFITPNSFHSKEVEIFDRFGNKGTVRFLVKHNHLLDFLFEVDVVTSNLLLYDVPEHLNPEIYGTMFGQGSTQIRGNERLVTIDANIKNNPNSSLGFNFTNASTAENHDFVRFTNEPPPTPSTIYPQHRLSPGLLLGEHEEAEIRINAVAEITEDAQIELILDPSGKDKIRGNGTGNFQIQYGTNTDFAMYGNYTISHGNYSFNLQQLMHHTFQIREGSRVLFQGDPLHANLDINAAYHLIANIEDLDESLVREMSRSSVPVNCVLTLNGQLQSPTISFDLEFPNSTEEMRRQVKAFIDTEEMMTRQVIYLLVLKKFYTPDYSKNAFRAGELSAVASSALSAQLSHLLSSITDKVQIGTNIRSRQDGITDTEVEMLLSSQLLDNRLRFNGNFGYKNNFIQSNAFVGEFDLEYKLTPRGEIRLKAYNHANDMYRYNMKSLTRQGVGVMFRKDFSSLKELFKHKTAPVKNRPNKEAVKEEEETSTLTH